MINKTIYTKEPQNQFFIKDGSKNKYGQYFTPRNVADFMISLSDVNRNARILEPSCGEGIFLKLLLEKGYYNLSAYEIDKDLGNGYDFINYESFVSANINDTFDLIIGNPPYIRWKNLETELKDELSNNGLWNKYFNSLCDYLYIFILKSIELLNENGQLIFICPEYWMNTTHSISLRNYMVKEGYFEKIYHFNETPIFTNASVSILIFKYIKYQKPKKPKIDITKYYKNRVLTDKVLGEIKNGNCKNSDIECFKVSPFQINKRWMLSKSSEVENIRKFESACINSDNCNYDIFGNSIEKNYSTIGDICDIGNGLVSGLDRAFQLNGQKLTEDETRNTINVIKAKNLNPFYYDALTKYIFVNDVKNEIELKTKFPNFFQKLYNEKEKLLNRYQYNKKMDYWQWVFLRNFNLFNSSEPRIFVPCKERISNKDYFRFSYVGKGIFPTQDVTAIFTKSFVKEDLHYVLAFLNNYRVFNWLKNKGIIKGNIVEFSEKPISSIPFRKIKWNDEKEVVLHNQISMHCKKYIKTQDDFILGTINNLFNTLLG